MNNYACHLCDKRYNQATISIWWEVTTLDGPVATRGSDTSGMRSLVSTASRQSDSRFSSFRMRFRSDYCAMSPPLLDLVPRVLHQAGGWLRTRHWLGHGHCKNCLSCPSRDKIQQSFIRLKQFSDPGSWQTIASCSQQSQSASEVWQLSPGHLRNFQISSL